jgi:TRAP-type mannitol/chloroaromatic compound transport system substrate-binding protein
LTQNRKIPYDEEMKTNKSRRDLLKASAFGAVALTAANPFDVVSSLTGQNLNFKIGMNSWLPSAVKSEIHQLYRSSRTAHSFSFESISTVPSFSEFFKTSPYDALITSPALHPGLNKDYLFFGGLPYGYEQAQQAKWLTSPESRQLQKEFFAQLGATPQLLGMGSASMGFFSKCELNQVSDYFQKTIAVSGVRSSWFSKHGAIPRSLTPLQQQQQLKDGNLDISNIYPASVAQYVGTELGPEFSFTLFPRVKTAHTVYILWKSKVWERLEAEQPRLEEISHRAFARVSEQWRRQELQKLSEIQRRFEVKSVPQSMVEAFKEQAQEFTHALAARSPYSQKLAQVHSEFGSIRLA